MDTPWRALITALPALHLFRHRSKIVRLPCAGFAPTLPPTILILHAENAATRPGTQADSFGGALKAAGVETTVEVANGRGHGAGGPNSQPMIKVFFDKYLKEG